MKLPDFSCNGRVALVTGAARGIGLATARALAAAGAAVAIHDIDGDLASTEAAAINAAGGRAIGISGDATDVRSAETLVTRAAAELGEISILINNASVQKWDNFVDVTIEEMSRQLNANVLFVTRLCQLVVPAMQTAGWGRIINLGSIQGRVGNAHMPIYAMSKAAMENLTSGLARALARHAITVNCVAPGWFITHRTQPSFKDEEAVKRNAKQIPLQRIGDPEDCDGIMLLLCSEAGEYITGQTIRVDGGMSI